jgi:hypothetical protein
VRALIPLVILGSFGPSGTVRAAEPVLTVRARARLEIDVIRREHPGPRQLELVIMGRLLDDAGEPISQGTVALALDGANGFYRYAEPTGSDGRFGFRAPLRPGTYRLELAGGKDDPLYEPATAITRTLDLARTTPLLSIRAAGEVSAAQETLAVEITASQAPEDDDLDVSAARLEPIELGPITVAVDGRTVARETCDGRLRLELPVAKLGAPGRGVELSARFEGDELRNPAEAVRSVRVTGPTRLTLTASSGELPSSGRVELSGQLTAPLPQGTPAPIADAPVEIFTIEAEPRPIAAVRTDQGGRFRVTLEGGREPPGTLFLEARFSAASSFRAPSRSPAITLAVLAPAPRRLGFFLSPVFTLFAIGGVVLARRVRARASSLGPSGPPDGWARLARRAAAVARRAVSPHASGGPAVAEVPVRDRIFALYRELALPLLPEPRLAEIWTPRELLRHVGAFPDFPDSCDLGELAKLVERACFGPCAPDEAALAEAERLSVSLTRRP